MTALKDAMTKARIDTKLAAQRVTMAAAAPLRKTGSDALKAVPKFSRMLRKRPHLFDALVLDYLRRVAADMPADVSVRAHKVRAHKRHHPRPRTQDEKDAALRAAGRENLALRSVFDSRKIDGLAND